MNWRSSLIKDKLSRNSLETNVSTINRGFYNIISMEENKTRSVRIGLFQCEHQYSDVIILCVLLMRVPGKSNNIVLNTVKESILPFVLEYSNK